MICWTFCSFYAFFDTSNFYSKGIFNSVQISFIPTDLTVDGKMGEKWARIGMILRGKKLEKADLLNWFFSKEISLDCAVKPLEFLLDKCGQDIRNRRLQGFSYFFVSDPYVTLHIYLLDLPNISCFWLRVIVRRSKNWWIMIYLLRSTRFHTS